MLPFDKGRDLAFEIYNSVLIVRSTEYDVLLTTVGYGVIGILILLYIVYMLVRAVRRVAIPDHVISKADRPLWIFMLSVAGAVWIFNSLMQSGSTRLDPELFDACTLCKFFGQYLFGWSMWVNLVLYKLVRKYYQLRRVKKKPPHAVLAICVLTAPYLVVAILAVLFDESGRDEDAICLNSRAWLLTLYGVAAGYTALFAFVMISIRKTMGKFHQIYRYAIFLGSSFLFPIVDGTVQLSWLGAYVPFQQGVTTLVIIIVVVNLTHHYALVMRNKRRPRIADTVQDTRAEEDLETVSVSTLPDDFYETDTKTVDLDVINVVDTNQDTPKAAVAGDGLMLQKPRRTLSNEMLPDFAQFIDQLPAEATSNIDRTCGFYAYKSRPRVRQILEFDLETARKYLKQPPNNGSDP